MTYGVFGATNGDMVSSSYTGARAVSAARDDS